MAKKWTHWILCNEISEKTGYGKDFGVKAYKHKGQFKMAERTFDKNIVKYGQILTGVKILEKRKDNKNGK